MDARTWLFGIAAVVVVAVVWVRVGEDDRKLFDGVERTTPPRRFGRIEKGAALDRVNAFYAGR